MTANDIAAFARDSPRNKVTVLGPADFPQRVVDSRDPWVVDFYAPVNSNLIILRPSIIYDQKWERKGCKC